VGRGLLSSTSQLNPSRFGHLPECPCLTDWGNIVSRKMCLRSAEKWTSVSPCQWVREYQYRLQQERDASLGTMCFFFDPAEGAAGAYTRPLFSST